VHNTSSDDNRNIKDDDNTINNTRINEKLNPIEETESHIIEKDKKRHFTFAQKK